MEKEILKNIRKEFMQLSEEQDMIKSGLSELEILKNNPIVQRYIELSKLDNKYNNELIENTKEEILIDVFNKHKFQSTNDIYFYLGNIGENNLYKNIENDSNIEIVKEYNKYDFESMNIIIYPKTANPAKEYIEIRKKYIEKIVASTEKVIDKVK